MVSKSSSLATTKRKAHRGKARWTDSDGLVQSQEPAGCKQHGCSRCGDFWGLPIQIQLSQNRIAVKALL